MDMTHVLISGGGCPAGLNGTRAFRAAAGCAGE
jgi:hypothetical protein